MPRRKSKEPALAELEAAPLEAHPKRKRPRKSDEPTAVAEPLRQIVEAIPGITTGDHLLTQLPPPVAEPDTARTPRAEEVIADALAESQKTTHVGRLEAERPQFGPDPVDFRNVARFDQAGIRVQKKLYWDGKQDRSVAAIQFAHNRIPSREEKDLLEAIGEPNDDIRERIKFSYDKTVRAWLRESLRDEPPGSNLVDAVGLAKELADGRIARGR